MTGCDWLFDVHGCNFEFLQVQVVVVEHPYFVIH